MYCSSETCPHAWDENMEQLCYDCEFMTEPVKAIKKNIEEDCPGQLFFNFFHKS